MARHNLRLSKPRGAVGARSSRRASVRARDARSHKRNDSGAAARGHRPLSFIRAAAKRAMRKLALRDCGQRCVYCAIALDQRSATIDHVVPLARGGAQDPSNLVAACGPCNRLKGDLPPFEFFARHAWAGANFVRYARSVHRALKRGARRAVSLAFARGDAVAA